MENKKVFVLLKIIELSTEIISNLKRLKSKKCYRNKDGGGVSRK